MHVVLCPHCRGVNLLPTPTAGDAAPCGHCTRPFTVTDSPPDPPADRTTHTPVLRNLPIIRSLPPGGQSTSALAH